MSIDHKGPWTDPATLPADVRAKFLKIREALGREDLREAYHWLYAIADPMFNNVLIKGYQEPFDSLKGED